MEKKWAVGSGWRWGVLLVMHLLLAASAGLAGEPTPRIELTVAGQKEVVRIRDGQSVVTLAPMDRIASGDVLVYTVTYRNSGTSIAKDVTVVDPIPANTVYIPGSAAGADTTILFSIDGGATFREPPVLYKGRDSAGKEIVQPAPPEMYTHIKWIVRTPVNPNGTGTTRFKVKVK